MIGTGRRVRRSSPSLRHQVNALEQRLIQRRQRMRTLVTGAKRKVAARLSSSRTLLTAVGIGVAVEQVSHHRGWSFATVLDTTNAFIGLLLSLSSSMQQHATDSARRQDG